MGKQKFDTAIAQKNLKLQQASGENLPYDSNTFTKACTVNTVYFWSDPQAVLAECDRVLQPQGKLIICYNSPEFLAQIKLTQHGFTAYQPQALETLMTDAGFVDVNTVTADGGKSNRISYSTSGLVR